MLTLAITTFLFNHMNEPQFLNLGYNLSSYFCFGAKMRTGRGDNTTAGTPPENWTNS
jgi:hypothetical protein